MKYRSVLMALLILLLISISLVGCKKEEATETTSVEVPEKEAMSLEEEMEAIERQAEEARQLLIESLSNTASDPDTLRSVSGKEIDLDATGKSSGADE